MGIPSYYRKLVGSVGGLLYKSKPGTVVASGVGHFLMDFNCLIYHVLRDPARAAWPPTEDEQDQWTQRLYDDIVRYTMRVIKSVGAERVFIAVDGVVPMAKIRQQRMRRFRSAAAATSQTSPAFDSNAITPGTQFMRGLRTALEEMISDEGKQGRWILSSADEPGEGEHKVLQYLRELEEPSEKPYVVYGLDGDLIVLLLWTQALGITGTTPIWLYREDMENGEVVRDDKGKEQYCWFSIDRLRSHLTDSEGIIMEDYCAAMMLLGNDFLPTSLTFKIKDGGHNFLLGWLKTAAERGERFIRDTNTINVGPWRRLFKQLAAVEEQRFLETIQKKWRTVARNAEEELPLQWREEKIFLANPDDPAAELYLKKNWRSIYAQTAFFAAPGAETVAIKQAAAAYFASMAWIVQYYTGAATAMDWSYSWLLPPLWTNLLEEFPETVAAPLIQGQPPLQPIEQLALVLPAASWNLIDKNSRQSQFIKAAPEFFPAHFELESIGRRYTWEAEAKIPIPTINQLRAILESE